MATLVLVVVAITGAAAVGTMTGAFSDEVAEQVTTEDIQGGTSLLIAGSTTVQPVTELLAEAFMR
ncbi:MAG: hypothetical protein LRZ87_00255, partial [Methanocellales archaeon]|nr:hypothetical protein [Methanocellales archaeon]